MRDMEVLFDNAIQGVRPTGGEDYKDMILGLEVILQKWSDESKFCQNDWAKDQDGKSCLTYDPQAVCWCLGGIVGAALDSKEERSPEEFWHTRRQMGLIGLQIRDRIAPQTIQRFNDSHSFQEVRKLLEDLLEENKKLYANL